jgi:hypothetical protein
MFKRIKSYNTFFILLFGMALTQIISTIHLYCFFLNFKNSFELVKNSGYLLIPNSIVLNQLTSFKYVMCGGFFITITLGAFLTLITVFFVKLSDQLNRKRAYLPVLIMQITTLILVNINGTNPIVSIYFIVIPSMVYLLTIRLIPKNRKVSVAKILWHLIPVIILVALFSTQYNRSMFHNIRDSVLLTNPIGRSINTFYYNYTLLPASLIKPIHKKILKTYKIEADDSILKRKIKHLLVKYDFLEMNFQNDTDLTIKEKNYIIELYKGNNHVLKERANNFFINPGKTIRKFSRLTDKNYYFRSILLLSLLIGLPLAIYIIISSMIDILISLALRKESYAGSLVCFLAGFTLFILVYNMNIKVKETNLKDMLISNSWKERACALKYISYNNIEIDQFKNIKNLSKDVTPVKYWFTIALGKSRTNRTASYILEMLDDNDLIIRCKAVEALGLLRKNRFIKVLKKKIHSSKHWYVQLNAYKALRRTGWNQKILN